MIPLSSCQQWPPETPDLPCRNSRVPRALSQRLDLAKTDFRNGGHAVRYHANSLDIIFYDKIKDLERARISEKRAIERDNIGQIDLFKGARSLPKQLEVLRPEF